MLMSSKLKTERIQTFFLSSEDCLHLILTMFYSKKLLFLKQNFTKTI